LVANSVRRARRPQREAAAALHLRKSPAIGILIAAARLRRLKMNGAAVSDKHNKEHDVADVLSALPLGAGTEKVDESGKPDTEVVATPSENSEPALDHRAASRTARLGNTAMLLERLRPTADFVPPVQGDLLAPYGFFQGRPIIGSHSRIAGGVYLGRRPREAIVVDFARQAGDLLRVYREFIEQIQTDARSATMWPMSDAKVRRRASDLLRGQLCARVRALIAREMPFSRPIVAQIARDHKLGADDKILLDVYIRRHGGVCRHQVCLIGALLERLVDEDWLQGRIAIVRKHAPGHFSHAWIRYDGAGGAVYIFDAAQDLYVELQQLEADGQAFYGGN